MEIKLLRSSWRINLQRFYKYIFLLIILPLLFFIFLVINFNIETLGLFFVIYLILFAPVIFYMLAIKRLHDIWNTAMWSIIYYIPIIWQLILFYDLLFVKWNKWKNNFWEDPLIDNVKISWF